MNQYDFMVIGSGPGGYIAAIRAAQLGYSVVVVEKENSLGGVCLNWGCIPTKSLLKSAEVYAKLKDASSFGIKVMGNVEVDLSAIVKRSREAVGKLNKGVASLMHKHNIAVNFGFAKFLGGGKISVSSEGGGEYTLSARHILIATGASPKVVPGLDEDVLWTAQDAMLADTPPKSLLIIGSGAIGIEFASFYSILGSKVTLVEKMDRILPLEDRDISEAMCKILNKQGVEILSSSYVNKLQNTGSLLEAEILFNNADASKKAVVVSCEKVISAIGIQPNTRGLGLENTKVVLSAGGFVVINSSYRTDEPGVYAIGDVVGPPCLAHKASHEAIACVEAIAASEGTLGRPAHKLTKANIPSCIYSIPQIASIGLTEEQARTQGFNVKTGISKTSCSGKAIASGIEDGFVKVVLDSSTGEILGAHMIGDEVTEMISGYTIARQLEATDLDILSTVFPHPTLSEMMHEAVLSALDQPLNG